MSTEQRIETEEEERFDEAGREIVACPHCGTDCHWESAESGWILVNIGTEGLTLEEAIHYCPKHPDAIEFDEDEEGKGLAFEKDINS